MQALPSHGVSPTYASVLGDMRGLVKAESVAVLWRGLGPTLWRDVPFSGELLAFRNQEQAIADSIKGSTGQASRFSKPTSLPQPPLRHFHHSLSHSSPAPYPGPSPP